MKRLAVLAFALLVTSGCAAAQEQEEEESAEAGEAAFTDSRSAVAVTWGSELWYSPAENRPYASWPGVFHQPAMRSGPGSCGFAATANITAQLLSGPGAERRPITPWDVLDRVSYNTIYGVRPGVVMSTLDAIFADRSVVGDMQGTRFSWMHLGYAAGRATALAKLRETLGAGKPFIALINYNGDGGWLNFSGNHYVVVAGMTNEHVVIAHWGRYEYVAHDTFLRWWESHSVYSFSGIVPNRASQLGQARAP